MWTISLIVARVSCTHTIYVKYTSWGIVWPLYCLSKDIYNWVCCRIIMVSSPRLHQFLFLFLFFTMCMPQFVQNTLICIIILEKSFVHIHFNPSYNLENKWRLPYQNMDSSKIPPRHLFTNASHNKFWEIVKPKFPSMAFSQCLQHPNPKLWA